MAATLDTLQAALSTALGDKLRKAVVDRGQLTIEIASADLVAAAGTLRDDAALAFTELLDLIGIDYRGYANAWAGPRYAVVYNLISIRHNARVRIRVFCANDDFPAVDTASGLPVQGPSRDDIVVVVEKWESLPALEAHSIAPRVLSPTTSVSIRAPGTGASGSASNSPRRPAGNRNRL